MNWLNLVQKLQQGQEIQFRPSGHSMTGKINHKQLVTVKPEILENIKVNDVVLCKVNGKFLLHLVTAKNKDRIQISNNKGHVNGWTKTVFGKVTKVED